MISDKRLKELTEKDGEVFGGFYLSYPSIVKEMAQELLEARKIISVDTGRLVNAAKKADILYVGCDTPDALADEVLSLRQKIGALEAELEYNEEGYKKMRHKINLLKEDAERLARGYDYNNKLLMSIGMVIETGGETILDKHKQVMRKVDPPTLSSFIGCMKEVK